MKRILTLALLAHAGVAQAELCEADGVWPASISGLTPSFEAYGFHWLSPLPRPAGVSAVRADECIGLMLPKPQPKDAAGLVNSSQANEISWGVNLTSIEPVNALAAGSEGYPYWSLQLRDSASGLGVLTATLYPGLQQIGISLTTQRADAPPIVQTHFLSYKEQWSMTKLRFDLVKGGNNSVLYLSCDGQIQRWFKLPGSLLPHSVIFGKLAEGDGPPGRFGFMMTTGTNPGLPIIGADTVPRDQ